MSNERSYAAFDPLVNEIILPLAHRISDETNKTWYNAKLKNKLVVKGMILNLLESQVGVEEHFRAMGETP